jgi:hypothetical protein
MPFAMSKAVKAAASRLARFLRIGLNCGLIIPLHPPGGPYKNPLYSGSFLMGYELILIKVK